MSAAILVGQLDSPYVRRVAVSAMLLGIGFEQRPWSVGADQAKLREVNPLGRVPAWIEADGHVLAESGQIVDHLDDLVGPQRALMPADAADRRATRQWLGLLTGVLDKGFAVVVERIFQPAAMHGSPWTQRCAAQLRSGLEAIERGCIERADHEWLVDNRETHADVAFACFLTYLRDALPLDVAHFPALAARLARIEARPAFVATYTPFAAPVPGTNKEAAA